MSRRQCQNCRHFVRALGELTGECRIRSVPQDDFPKRSAAEDCGEWADKTITPEQHEQRELAARFAVAIVQGCYANPEGNQVNFVMESQRLARDFFEAQAEGQT